jgi:Putative lumazine-binding
MSDTVRRRIAAALLVAAVIAAVLAIEDLGPFEDPPTEEERARAAVERFFGAAAEGDSKTFCALLTADAREQLRLSTAQRLQTDELPECTKILDVLAPAFADSVLTIRYVSVSGNRARVEARYKLASGPAQPRTVLLLEEDGEWRISDPG